MVRDYYWILFDIAAFIIDAIMIFSMVLRHFNQGRKGVVLFVFMLINITACICDVLAVLDINPYVVYAANSLYYTLRAASPMIQLIYIICSSELSYRYFNTPLRTIAMMFPAAVFVTFNSFVNPFTKSLFWIDTTTGVYHRGEWILIIYIISAIYMIASLRFTIKYAKYFQRGELITFLFAPLITIICLVIQWIYPNILVEMFGTSMILVVYSLFMENPDDLMNGTTGVHTYKKFRRDMEMTIAAEDQKTVLISCIDNYQNIKSLINRIDLKNMIDTISLKLRTMCGEILNYSNIYYLGRGVFIISFDRTNKKVYDTFLKNYENLSIQFHASGKIEFNIEFSNVVVNVPNEMPNFQELEKMMNYVVKKPFETTKIYYYKDLIDDKEFQIEYNIDSIIKHAFNEDRFEIYVQPIYEVKSKKIRNGEVLLRLTDKLYGPISPAILIPAAERNGSIKNLSTTVYEKTLKFLSTDEFKKSGIEYLEMNLSIHDLLDTNLMDNIMAISRKYDGADDLINFELTESQDGYEMAEVKENIRLLKEYGFSLALDDYGTGYSNMGRLGDLPFSIVKIDYTLSRKITDPKMKIVIEDTIKLIHHLGMGVVVEGVETKEMLDEFVSIGADYVQGFYFSKAIPAEEFLNYVKTFNSNEENK